MGRARTRLRERPDLHVSPGAELVLFQTGLVPCSLKWALSSAPEQPPDLRRKITLSFRLRPSSSISWNDNRVVPIIISELSNLRVCFQTLKF